MAGPASVHPKRASAANLAYEALKQHGQPMSYKELIQVILAANTFAAADVGRLKAQIHTEINLDSRFDHQGGGLWGLREWSYRGGKVITVKAERTPARPVSKTRQLLEEEFGGGESSAGDDPDADDSDDELDDPTQPDSAEAVEGDDDAGDTGDEWDE